METSSPHSYGLRHAGASTDAPNGLALPNNLPNTSLSSLQSHLDDKPLARQKRKRTSPEDQAVLEAAYKRDPKPDKTARIEIVKQVSLGEKEVQIWFQNRRQSSRRKSRPLLPHEIAQYQMARSGRHVDPYSTGSDPSSEIPEDRRDLEEEQDDSQLSASGTPGCNTLVGRDAQRPSSAGDLARSAPMPHLQSTTLPQTEHQLRPPITTAAAWEQGRHSLGYLADRRSAESLRQSKQNMVPTTAPISDALAGDRHLKKSSSFIRLSMSFDGNASVVTKNGEEPSPPRAPQIILPPLASLPIPAPQFSSADQARDTAARSSLQRSSSGRSRDSRAWEFWCDKDARSELEEKAEKDSSGSAADAIGLLRSASGRSILGSLPTKRNPQQLSRHASDLKRLKPDARRPPLQRSSTSQGRLQGDSSNLHPSIAKPRPKLKPSESEVALEIPDNESDKENWSPDRPRHPSSQQQANSHSHRPALTENKNAANTPQHIVTNAKRFKPSPPDNAEDYEDREPDRQRSERKGTSTSSSDDLDCVQGLLSLSQGNWR